MFVNYETNSLKVVDISFTQFVHVKCRVSGTGHIRLRLRHKKHTGGNWINRDPAAVADTTSGNVRAIWCEDENVIAINPSWIFTDLYSS